MTTDEQLNEWVNGNSIHNYDRNECCPDFSCCQKHYKATKEEREIFRDRLELREKMLMGFLAGAIANEKIHIAGSIEGNA